MSVTKLLSVFSTLIHIKRKTNSKKVVLEHYCYYYAFYANVKLNGVDTMKLHALERLLVVGGRPVRDRVFVVSFAYFGWSWGVIS